MYRWSAAVGCAGRQIHAPAPTAQPGHAVGRLGREAGDARESAGFGARRVGSRRQGPSSLEHADRVAHKEQAAGADGRPRGPPPWVLLGDCQQGPGLRGELVLGKVIIRQSGRR